MQVVIVVFCKLVLAQGASFPGGNIGNDEGQHPKRIVRGHDRQTQHITERNRHKQCFQARAHLYCMTLNLVPVHSIEKIAQGI